MFQCLRGIQFVLCCQDGGVLVWGYRETSVFLTNGQMSCEVVMTRPGYSVGEIHLWLRLKPASPLIPRILQLAWAGCSHCKSGAFWLHHQYFQSGCNMKTEWDLDFDAAKIHEKKIGRLRWREQSISVGACVSLPRPNFPILSDNELRALTLWHSLSLQCLQQPLDAGV